MIKNFINKVDIYWFFTIFTVALCFGFFISNHSMGIDDEILYYYNSLPLSTWDDRFLQFFFGKLFASFEYTPYFTSLLAIIIYTFTITLYSDIFIKYAKNFEKKSAAIFSCIALSFPFIAFIFIFNLVSIAVPIGILLSGLSVLFFCKYIFEEKKIKYLFFIILLELCAWSLFQISIFYFVICSLFIIYTHLINAEEKSNNNLQPIKSFSLVFILATIVIFINSIIINIFCHIYNMSANRFHSLINLDFSSVSNFFSSYINSLKEFCTVFIKHIMPLHGEYSCNTACTVTLICYFTFLILALVYTLRKRNMLILLYGLTMLAVPFGVLLITGVPYLPYRTYAAAGFINAVTIVLLYNLFIEKPVLKQIITILAGIIVFYQALEINRIFYTENVKVANDKVLANTLMYDIHKKGIDNKPLVIIGVRENAASKFLYYDGADEINTSTFNWDRYDSAYREIKVIRPYAFMRELGYNAVGFFEDTEYSAADLRNYISEIETAAADMNNYPQENSIKELDEFILIKIGKSRFKELNNGNIFEEKELINKFIFNYR